MLSAVAAVALVSCNKEIEKPVEEQVTVGEGIQVTINAVESDTKTYIEGTTPKWKATDAVGVYTGAAGANVKFTNTKADGEAAVFEGTVPASGTYYAYYPYSSATPNENGQFVQIPSDQHPTPTSFDGAADILISQAIEINTTDATTVNTRFRRLGSFLKFVFVDGTTGSRLNGVTATKVSVIVDNVYGDGSYRPCPSVRVKPDGLGLRGSGMKTISANYDAGVFELTADGNAVYLGILPQPFASGSSFDITITAGDATIKKKVTLPSDVELKGGQILPIKITLKDAEYPEKTVKVAKVWEKLSDSSSWFTQIGGSAENDFNIAIDDKYVYVTDFGGSKKLLAIDIATGNNVKEVNTSTVESVGYNGAIYLSCARVVKKNDGTPILIATNLFQDGAGTNDNPTGRLYVWENGIDEAPAVKTMKQWEANRRLGDTFTTYGNYEDCWLIMSTQDGAGKNGFVTFKVPISGSTSTLISRLAIDTDNFCSYYPFPGDLINGMFSWRNGDHDDGTAFRNRKMTVSSTEAAIKSEGAHTATLTKLDKWMANYENNNGGGFNFVEFNGKRYAIWVINMADNKTFDIIIKEGSTETAWDDIINTPSATIAGDGGFAFRESLVGGLATSWKMGVDCAVWNTGEEVYIAVNKTNVGIALYKLYAE